MLTLASPADAQIPLTWSDVRARFEAANLTLQADSIGIQEARANEVTAFLRPNPECGLSVDQIGNTVTTGNGPGDIFSAAILSGNCSYLYEREHKRDLRLESAQRDTAVVTSTHADLQRTLLFSLRSAFVQLLQAKAALALARDNLAFYDQVLTISRQRFQAGDIAQVDLERLRLQRVQFESAVESADVNTRSAKIQLLTLLSDRTPPDRFDVTGPFDLDAALPALDDLRRQALDGRPDLRAAQQGVDLAKLNHQLATANGSADPTVTVNAGFPSISQAWQSYAPPLRQYVGIGLAIPIRIFDRNQGEKLRTQLEITKTERLADVARAQVLGDVDLAYATLTRAINLLRPYRDLYLSQSTLVRDIITQSYQRGGASLLEFLQAEQDYRTVQLNYITLVGSYLTSVAQINEAIGQEVIR
jgi:cobalt-zinc-cadmium efflux system outer membrane protein